MKPAEPAIETSSLAQAGLSNLSVTQPIAIARHLIVQPAQMQQAAQDGRSGDGGAGEQTREGIAAGYRVEGSTSSQGQTLSGEKGDRPLAFTSASGTRREATSSSFNRLDAPGDLAPSGRLSGDSGIAPSGAKQPADQVIAAVMERAESLKPKGRAEARFDIRTDDGSAISVKIAVHRNAVWARIGVSTGEMRDALACRVWELGQRLESGGLMPQSIEVVLMGGWSEGPHDEQRRPPKQRADHAVRQDSAAATMVEAERREFEHWA
jgi:hypothetical protein